MALIYNTTAACMEHKSYNGRAITIKALHET